MDINLKKKPAKFEVAAPYNPNFGTNKKFQKNTIDIDSKKI